MEEKGRERHDTRGGPHGRRQRDLRTRPLPGLERPRLRRHSRVRRPRLHPGRGGQRTEAEGPAGVHPARQGRFDAMPDGRFTLDHLTAQGDTVVVEYTGEGTQTGDLSLHAGTLPATGRHVTVHACDIYEVKDGKIQQGRAYLDTGAIMSQLGLTEQLQT
ncbi:ester cyclase [Streptomyces fradiae]|uniref:ester cyclase n=1 Tax=Streptomyces fradiae TaxID=1906 RepID=UPI0036CBA564